uniref:NAD(P)/FAD-dependent oxidoreductase n=1 Tax=uncultured Georgenia sp. TaxID=378209 RepID=UPI002610FA9F
MGTWDVIVVGSRIAGASTALLLARAGLRVLVLDRARRGSDTLSTHALMRAGVLQLSRWGVLDEVVRGTPPVRRTLFHYYDEDPVTVSIRPSPGVPALYAPRRTVLDTVLADAAERAGATVRHGTAVTGVLRDEYGRVTGVRTRRRGGPDGAERAPLVVGADGLRSAVADAVGAPVLWRGEAATNVLYGYVTDLPAAGYEWYYGAGVGAGLIPTHDGLTCVFAGTTRTELDRLLATVPPAVALTLLARRLPDLVERLTAGGQ